MLDFLALRQWLGLLAQLVERLNGIEEVSGSNPLGSTTLIPASAGIVVFKGKTSVAFETQFAPLLEGNWIFRGIGSGRGLTAGAGSGVDRARGPQAS
jgi:hypothetical protein